MKLERWDRQSRCEQLDRFAIEYTELFHCVDHIADFNRLKDEIDQTGEHILQRHLNSLLETIQPLFQRVLDSTSDTLTQMSSLADQEIENRPNLSPCFQSLISAGEVIAPTSDYEESADLSVEGFVEWRDRLLEGLEALSYANAWWVADALDLDIPPQLMDEIYGQVEAPLSNSAE